MKKAFTLAELVIVLGVIGIASALIIPAVSHLRPDKTKVAYLKAYDTISERVRDLSSNSMLYPICDTIGSETVSCQQIPLFSLESTRATRSGYVIPHGNGKLCNLIAEEFNIQDDNNNCSDVYLNNYTEENFANNISFVTRDNIPWIITTHKSLNGNQGEYETDIYFDINGLADGPNCLYDSEVCTNPDRFKLMVAASGEVIVADPVGEYYIKTRKNLNKQDIEPEENSIVMASLESNLRNFTVFPCQSGDGELDGGNGAEINPPGSSSPCDDKSDPSFVMMHGECRQTPKVRCGDLLEGLTVICYDFVDRPLYRSSPHAVRLLRERGWDYIINFKPYTTPQGVYVNRPQNPHSQIGHLQLSEAPDKPILVRTHISGMHSKYWPVESLMPFYIGTSYVAYVSPSLSCDPNYIDTELFGEGKGIYYRLYKCKVREHYDSFSYFGPACDDKYLYVLKQNGDPSKGKLLSQQEMKKGILWCSAFD